MFFCRDDVIPSQGSQSRPVVLLTSMRKSVSSRRGRKSQPFWWVNFRKRQRRKHGFYSKQRIAIGPLWWFVWKWHFQEWISLLFGGFIDYVLLWTVKIHLPKVELHETRALATCFRSDVRQKAGCLCINATQMYFVIQSRICVQLI